MAARVWGDYGDEARALVLTLAYAGLRPGELAALKRANVRLAAAELVVDATVDATGGEKPQNGKPRVVTIPPLALRALASVPARVDSPYVFHTARGRRLSKGSLSYLGGQSPRRGARRPATRSTCTSCATHTRRCCSNAA
ncbi:MAG TPA: site-specific integrase [Solirubrobacteraceae bacterium]|jgi:integrase|nr:site-specific integrase [Solirubrobacteraceae bacterium]